MTQNTKRLEVKLSSNEEDITIRTFILRNEDHTFGNALRYIISKNPEVEYCGYSVPHPSIHDINFRVQTKTVPAADVFKKGLEDLQELCEQMNSTFTTALEDYKENKMNDIEKAIEDMHT